MRLEKEKNSIVKLVAEYSNPSTSLVPLNEKYGLILDNLAMLCYQKALDVTGLQPGLSQPQWFAHQGIAHGFMEFVEITGINQYVGGKPAQAQKFTRIVYDRFCKLNEVPQDLVETGWQEYLK
jgi:hypothetical protein